MFFAVIIFNIVKSAASARTLLFFIIAAIAHTVLVV